MGREKTRGWTVWLLTVPIPKDKAQAITLAAVKTRARNEPTGLCVSRGDAEGSLTAAHAFTAKGRASEFHRELTNFQRRCYSKVNCVPSRLQTEGSRPQVSSEKLTWTSEQSDLTEGDKTKSEKKCKLFKITGKSISSVLFDAF